MFCSSCGTKNPDDAVFCENCGKRLVKLPTSNNPAQEPAPSAPGPEQTPSAPAPVPVMNATRPARTETPGPAASTQQGNEAPVSPAPAGPDTGAPVAKKKKKGLLIGIIAAASALVLAAAVFIGIGLIKSGSFKDKLEEYDVRASKLDDLGSYTSDYLSLKSEAEDLSFLQFWKYSDYEKRIGALLSDAELLNDEISGFRSEYDQFISRYSGTGSAFGSLQADYDRASDGLQKALNSRDKDNAQKYLADMRSILQKAKDADTVRSEYDTFSSRLSSSGLILGTLQSDYDYALSEFQKALNNCDKESAQSYLDRMRSIRDEAELMNLRIAEWKQKRDQYVQKLNEDDYSLLTYQSEYDSALTAADNDIARFDEAAAESSVEKLGKTVDKIIDANKDYADYCIRHAGDLNDKVNRSGYYFYVEKLRTASLADELTQTAQLKQYSALEEALNKLDNWVNRIDSIESLKNSSRSEVIESWLQADVSENNIVKLYFKASNDSDYRFLVEDFIIYEQDGNVWNECKAMDISQIAGAMSMDIVADVSGSMAWYDNFYNMQCAIESFVNQTSSDTFLGLSTIGTIYERRQNMTTDKQSIINSVWGLDCYGLTSLYQSLYSSVVYTAGSKGSRCVVAFTDGINEPYGSGYDFSADDVIRVSQYYQVPVYIIGVGTGVDRNTLQYIAESTGGKYYDSAYASQLGSIYSDIYTQQGKLFQLSYESRIQNDANRNVYVYYADENTTETIRLESTLDAETLQEAYETADLDPNDLTSFYSETRALSTDELLRLGDNLENVQTIINIYFAKFGYKFANQEILKKMINMGVITSNGTLSGSAAEEKMKKNALAYQNYSAMFNYRYELIYKAALQIYTNNPSITYDNLRIAVHQYYNEPNQNRYSDATKAAWNALHRN